MPTLIFYWLISSVNCMGLRFSSGSAPHSSSLNGSHCSGSARTGSKNVGFSATGKSQFSEIASGSDDREESLGRILKWPNLKVFSFEELISASRRFRYDIQGLVIGKGCFGPVYKGWLDENTLTPAKVGYGMAVAIKMFNQDYFRGFEEWQSEVNFLGRLSHPNLVNLLGYCWDEDKLLLVYEFMPKGSLDYHLFRGNITPLSWNTRLKIAIGAAWGLAFLHASENNVIFSDFKASNILLDGNYNAKISDFGFARWGPFEGESHVSTRVIGTYDYAPPEYIATGRRNNLLRANKREKLDGSIKFNSTSL
ncbi:probable serine/threonine-protein kinase CST isoform X2 [Glycine soja]|uniref:probable serine/threonine-protein kinase CST isoform X2 n=1 Tax=Glycine soja TaxID=3848 RepID=UPI00104088CC|nr:probable serine/threonine-protein kinase CST isoform X2 [Glycine soja]